jgi:hypothetical protein
MGAVIPDEPEDYEWCMKAAQLLADMDQEPVYVITKLDPRSHKEGVKPIPYIVNHSKATHFERNNYHAKVEPA